MFRSAAFRASSRSGRAACLAVFATFAAIAGVTTVDFNQDPVAAGLVTAGAVGSGQWRASGGASGQPSDGYFALTDAVGGQSSTLIFKDFDQGRLVLGFTFEADLRIGGTTSGSPADGCSFNYVSADDPLVVRGDGTGYAGTDGEPGTDTDPSANGLPEEGSSTGIGVGFDSWESGSIGGVQDVVGISVRSEGALMVQFPVPLTPGNLYYGALPAPPGANYVYDNSGTYNNLAPADPNYAKSLQTGPLNPAYTSSNIASSWALLGWEHLVVRQDPATGFHLSWKGVELTPTAGLPLPFRPRAGRLVVGGRCGGANQNQHIDNVKLTTTVALSPVVGPVAGTSAGFSVEVFDGSGAAVAPASLHVALNGVDITAAGAVSQAAGVTTFAYRISDPAHWLPAGSSNTVAVHGIDSTGSAYSGGGSFIAAAPPPTLGISEFMAANKNTLLDEDGDSSDWIELFNPTTSPVNLSGWRLTSQSTNLSEWVFPGYVMEAGDYLVVFASGKNRTNVTAELHTNFRLSAAGGFLALVAPDGTIASSFAPAYPLQQTDVSYGRDPVQPELTGYFTTPTPGGENLSVGPGSGPAVAFSAAGGAFSSPWALTLTTSPGATIHYTLDGSAPTDQSPIYTNAIPVGTSVQVRSRAYAPGVLPGPIRSETYLLLASDLVSFQSSLPVVVIYNFGAGPVSTSDTAPPQFVNFAFFEPLGGVTRLTNAPTLSTRGSIHVRGSSTRDLPKQAWTANFWDELDQSADQAPFGLPAGSDWAFYAPDLFEPVLIHNPLAYELSNEIGRYAPRTKICEVIIALNSGAVSYADFNGIYVLEEKIKRGAERVDIDALKPDENTSPAVTGGYILRFDRLGVGETGLDVGGQTAVYDYPTEPTIKTPQRGPQQAYIGQYLNEFNTALYGSNFQSPSVGYAAYIDVDSWVETHILNVATFNVDALRLSAYFYKPRSGKVFFGPVWDFDRSQGSTDGRDFNPRSWRATTGDLGTDFFNYPWWGRLFEDPDFWQKWIDRYQMLRSGVLSTNHLFADIDALAAQVAPEQAREAARWPGYTTPRAGVVSMSGYSYDFPGTYQGEVNFLKQWYADRLNFMDTNFLAAPVLAQPGGPITAGFKLALSGPTGALLYYTLDGSDPRLPGGGVAPEAQLYTAPVPLSGNLVVTARAYNPGRKNLTGPNNPPLSSPWSGPARAQYGLLSSASAFAYGSPGSVYTQRFNDLPAPGAASVDAANPVTLAGVAYALANPFQFAGASATPGASGGLGTPESMDGWYGAGGLAAKFGAGDGDQSTGGVISFGPLTGTATTNRALGLQATSSTGPTSFGFRLLNNSGGPLGRIQLAYTGELWRQASVPKRVAFGYWVDPSGTNGFPAQTQALTNLDVFFPASPGATTPSPVDGLAPTNQISLAITNFPIAGWSNGAALWLVWRLDSDTGKGQGLAIDDLTFSALPPAPPVLTAARSGSSLILSWPQTADTDGFILQSAGGLDPGAIWGAYPGTVDTAGGVKSVTVSPGPAARFFRLESP